MTSDPEQACGQMAAAEIAAVFDLNYRQAVFVASYLGECRFNATRAALKAGYSPRHPRQSGSQAKGSMKVQNAISTLLNYYVANSQ